MIRLAKSTYALIAHRIREYGKWRLADELTCDICARMAKVALKYRAHWFLCEYHAREVGVLW